LALHVGHEQSNDVDRASMVFLQHHLSAAGRSYSQSAAYVPSWIEESEVWIIPPSIDPSPEKTKELTRGSAAYASGIGLLPELEGMSLLVHRGPADGEQRGSIERKASIVSASQRRLTSIVPSSSKCPLDRLKDMTGVMEGFASMCRRTHRCTARPGGPVHE